MHLKAGDVVPGRFRSLDGGLDNLRAQKRRRGQRACHGKPAQDGAAAVGLVAHVLRFLRDFSLFAASLANTAACVQPATYHK